MIRKDPGKLQNILQKLKENFEITWSEKPSTYLGMEIIRKEEGIYTTQRSYAKQMLTNFNMINCKSVLTPIVQEEKTTVSDNIKTHFPYREVVGSLLYMTNKTRPDMTFAVNYENRFLEKPDKTDVQNVKRTSR